MDPRSRAYMPGIPENWRGQDPSWAAASPAWRSWFPLTLQKWLSSAYSTQPSRDMSAIPELEHEGLGMGWGGGREASLLTDASLPGVPCGSPAVLPVFTL